MTASSSADVVVVGAGAIGASVARHLAHTGVHVLVLEKESGPALHQSGRNSGVIHAGYNLKPGSRKAEFCVEGSRRLRTYCREKGIPLHQGGILVVARSAAERPIIRELKARSDANGVQARVVDEGGIAEVEPQVRGVLALHAPEGASFDAEAFVRRLLEDARAEGAAVRYGTRVLEIREPPATLTSTSGKDRRVTVHTSGGVFDCAALVGCAGLHADRLAGPLAADVRVVPFRGSYCELRPERAHLVRSHIYPAPDLDFPFLGVHASRRTDGRVLLGPGAVLALGREAYRWLAIDPRDLSETLAWAGFRRLFADARYRRLAWREAMNSLSPRAVRREARRLLPTLQPEDLTRSFAGNRAQLVRRDGRLVDDFLIRETEHCVHVLNCVSPGLTASLPFGEYVAGLAAAKLEAVG